MEQPDGDVVQQLKSAEQKEETDKQVKSVDEVKPIEKQLAEKQPAENQPAEKQAVEKEARNGDIKIQVDDPSDKKEAVKEEDKEEKILKESRISIKADADEDEEAMEALLSHNMRETEIRWDLSNVEIIILRLAQNNVIISI